MTVLEGDLVLVQDDAEIEVEEEILATGEENTEVQEEKPAEKPCPVKHLTTKDLSMYTMHDVVFPIPGSSTVYPKNIVADWYQELLAEDGLTSESFDSRVRQFSLQGGYRKVLKKPKNMSWRIVKYTNPEDDLILSDAAIMEGHTLPEGDGPLRAVILSMDLDTSTYATMALREVLRADTSVSHQTKLNGPPTKREGEEDSTPDTPVKKSKCEGESSPHELDVDEGQESVK